jgi:hypothetical protein
LIGSACNALANSVLSRFGYEADDVVADGVSAVSSRLLRGFVCMNWSDAGGGNADEVVADGVSS